MRKLFSKAFGSIGTHLIGIHSIGVGISFLVFSYQYVKEHGFLRWLFWGELFVALKSIVWEAFLILALIQGPSHTATNPVLEKLTQDSWWVSEYPALVEMVQTANKNSLSTSYIVAADGRSKVELTLIKKPKSGLVLRSKLPKQAMYSVDPQTGDKIPSETTPVVTIRDHNMDGLPDDFRIEPSGEPAYKETFTEDGFTVYRDHPEHQTILAHWAVGIGYATNYFLHGESRLAPR